MDFNVFRFQSLDMAACDKPLVKNIQRQLDEIKIVVCKQTVGVLPLACINQMPENLLLFSRIKLFFNVLEDLLYSIASIRVHYNRCS